MTFERATRHRRSVRLKGYDYSQAGAYFVTVCTQDRICLFGEVVNSELRLNAFGKIVQEEWLKTAAMRPRVVLDRFVVMPNHVHGIITLQCSRGTLQRAPTDTQRAPTVEQFGKPTSDSISTIIRLFKSTTTKRVNLLRDTPGVPVWQRNYYEHIIRDDDSANRIRQYILDNPAHWTFDRENPAATAPEPEGA